MVVRVRFRYGPHASRPLSLKRRKHRHVALALATLLTPATLTTLALGLWKLAADLRVAGQFAIPSGLFSHWQVWFAVAGVIQSIVVVLNRYGNGQPLWRAAGGNPAGTLSF